MNLPRLLYVGDIPVEDSVASGTLLFRIFQEYPAESLCLVETNLMQKSGKPRLPGVVHRTLRIASKRLLHTRLHSVGLAWQWLAAGYYARRLASLVADFKPQAVVTTVPYSAWAIANSYAQLNSLPLHILLWDDILAAQTTPHFLQGRYQQAFFSAYRTAKSRLCISPQIEKFYAELSGASGRVVYPSASRDLPFHAAPPKQNAARRRFTFGFAGSLFLGGYRRALAQFARACGAVGCDLVVVGAMDPATQREHGLDYPWVTVEPYLPVVNQLVDFLRERADALVLVGSYEPTEERYCSMLFPSRLVVYAATALPCFAYGPETFGGMEWLVNNVGPDAICFHEDAEKLAADIRRFVAARDRHDTWGRAIASAGRRDFDYERARETYFNAFAAQ